MNSMHIRTLAHNLAAFACAGLLTAGAIVVGTAGSASAASVCYGYTCHGHDPVIYNCSASTTLTVPVKYNGTQVATLYNRYSQNCNANWGRAQLTAAGYDAHDSFLVEISTTDSLSKSENMCWPGPSNTGNFMEACTGTYAGSLAAYCDMVDGTHVTSAYIQVFNSGGNLIASGFADQ
jgi:hypothetical protein